MALSEEMASFIVKASYDDLSSEARAQLKIRVLDSLGCAIGAMEADTMRRLRRQLDDFGGREHCSLIGGGRTAPDRAAFYNSALIRYLDFNDSYLARNETCHPSDNLGAVLAASEYTRASGKDFLTALAVAYQVQCRLSEEAPVRAKGFDHTTQGSYAVAAGVSKALRLSQEQTVNAIAISGTAFNALRVTRTGALSNWKGLAYPNTAFGATHAAFLAMRGITGPREVFEGNKGFMEAIGGPFRIDWGKEDLERVTKTVIKRYNAEIHSQSAIEGILDLKSRHGFKAEEVARIELEIFDVAYHIIGGGEEGAKTVVRTKEEADHSLPYLMAVGVLDDRVMPEQFHPDRIQRSDVQELLRKVEVRPSPAYSERFPAEIPCRVSVSLQSGAVLMNEKKDYRGFYTNPMTWDEVAAKFKHLVDRRIGTTLCSEIVDAVAGLEAISMGELVRLLALAVG
jgi:2-methylcitrate dehydratase